VLLLRRYEQMFDIPYALPKLDVMALPNFAFQARMICWTPDSHACSNPCAA
jgi:aminopeptidase N